jgi:hypothetical protein
VSLSFPSVSTHHREKAQHSIFGSNDGVVTCMVIWASGRQDPIDLVALVVAVCNPHVVECFKVSALTTFASRCDFSSNGTFLTVLQ